jgi:hypothetical protein
MLNQARLVMEGEQFWEILGIQLGSAIMTVFRMLHPLTLYPTYMSASDFKPNSTSVTTTISIGTGEKNSR